MTKEQLISLLRRNGINPDEFGKPGRKSLDDLLTEINKGESTLTPRLVREVSVVTLNVFAETPGFRYKLVEDRQVFSDGTPRTRKQLPTSLQEKMHPGESAEDAIARALAEELQVTRYKLVSDIVALTEVTGSPSYPGILTVYRLHRVDVMLHPEEYKPDGYQEYDPDGGITSYFIWELQTPDKK